MIEFVEVLWYLLVVIIVYVTKVFFNSVGEFSACFSYIKGGTFGAGNEINDVSAGAGKFTIDVV